MNNQQMIRFWLFLIKISFRLVSCVSSKQSYNLVDILIKFTNSKPMVHRIVIAMSFETNILCDQVIPVLVVRQSNIDSNICYVCFRIIWSGNSLNLYKHRSRFSKSSKELLWCIQKYIHVYIYYFLMQNSAYTCRQHGSPLSFL